METNHTEDGQDIEICESKELKMFITQTKNK